ncbi:MAG: hypothetical protein MK160_01150 [Rhodobacteraceae bacterium]|nr:hypothetical protein [Paracoccaceae bacterium]
MHVDRLESPRNPEIPKPVEPNQPELFDAKAFNAKNIACVVSEEQTFFKIVLGLENLGFEVACSASLETTFKVVLEDPEDWAMIIVRLDQPLDEDRLEAHIRLLRMMDVKIPVLVMALAKNRKFQSNVSIPKLYADCVESEPTTRLELSTALQTAVEANMRWENKFDNFRRDSVNEHCQKTRK